MNNRLLLWTIGGFAMKKQMLDDRRFPKLHLNLQRLLQVRVTKPKAYSNTLMHNLTVSAVTFIVCIYS